MTRTDCCYCGFSTRNTAAMVAMQDGRTRCKSANACTTRLRSGTHLRRRVRLSLEAPATVDPPLVSVDRQRAERHERYRRGVCVDCGLKSHSPGRPRCTPCHEKMIEWRALGFGDE